MTIGILVLLLAGVCQGSFGLGYKKYKPFSWEAFWCICSILFSLIPFIWMCIQVPDFMDYFGQASAKILVFPLICGAFWGLTSIGFSKGVDDIGVSLVYGISMGVSAVIGSITPMVVNASYPAPLQFGFLILGIVITLFGIAVITKAGLIKENELSKENISKKNNSGSVMKTGLILALISGFGSGAMNIGFDYTKPITDGLSYIQASSIQWMMVLLGGSVSSAVYCIISISKNKTWHTLTEKGALKEFGKLIITCTVWFIALAAYGTAASMLGDMGPVAGWIIFNALALIISNGWGLKTGEWNGSVKGKRWILYGDAVLILSWVFIGLSNL